MNDIINKLKEINNNEIYDNWKNTINNKKVCIVGHSSYLLGSKKGNEIDGKDVVVRINEAFADIKEFKEDYGEKSDILYISNDHRFYHTNFLINNHQYIKNKIVSIFKSPEDFEEFQKFLKLLKENNSVAENTNKRKILIEELKGKLPNTGFFAILDVLSFNPKSLYLPGFCFYLDNTRILKRFPGYNTIVNRYHDGLLELKIFKELRSEYDIILDEYSENMIKKV